MRAALRQIASLRPPYGVLPYLIPAELPRGVSGCCAPGALWHRRVTGRASWSSPATGRDPRVQELNRRADRAPARGSSSAFTRPSSDLEHLTPQVIPYDTRIEEIACTVIDTPGGDDLPEKGNDDRYLNEIREKVQTLD